MSRVQNLRSRGLLQLSAIHRQYGGQWFSAHTQPPRRKMSIAAPRAPMLVRDYIASSLYDEGSGYFTSRQVVGSLGSGGMGLDFSDILNQREYREILSKAVRSCRTRLLQHCKDIFRMLLLASFSPSPYHPASRIQSQHSFDGLHAILCWSVALIRLIR